MPPEPPEGEAREGSQRPPPAVTVQCAWRVYTARRRVHNMQLRQWYLRKYVTRIQAAWRRYASVKACEARRAGKLRSLEEREQRHSSRLMAAFIESLLWRRSVCEEQAACIQRWYRDLVGKRRILRDVIAIVDTVRRVASIRPMSPAAKRVSIHSVHEETACEAPSFPSPVAEACIGPGFPMPLGADAEPRGGVVRHAVDGPPAYGAPGAGSCVNLRKEAREKAEHRLLEASIFLKRTQVADLARTLRRETRRLESTSASRIQGLYRRKLATKPGAVGAGFKAAEAIPAAGHASDGAHTHTPHPPPRPTEERSG